MSMDPITDLQAELEQSPTWPLKREAATLAKVRMHRAFRRSDSDYLEQLANYARLSTFNKDDRYVTDPLPRLVSTAFADLIFGEPPEVKAHADSDQDRLQEVYDLNQLPSELHRAERLCSSESEVWWRIYVDRAAAPVPIIQWVSRLNVVPLWRANRLVAVAFVSEVGRDSDVVTRHVEYQADGETRNLFYTGTPQKLGIRTNPPSGFEDLPEDWPHRLGMLAGRIVNGVDDDPTCGRSDYDGVEQLFLALNEANTIDAKNARLTARKRIFADASLVDPQTGRFNVNDDVIVTNSAGGTLGDDSSNMPPVRAVELSFDADQMQVHINGLTDRILTRTSVAPQLVGRITEGNMGADSGVALRARMMQSVLAAQGKARYWDDALPRLLALAQQVDALSEQEGGFGWPWAARAEPPSVERAEVLPEDPNDEALRLSTLAAAGLQSRFESVGELHPAWTDEQVSDELARIASDQAMDIPAVPGFDENLTHDDPSLPPTAA